MYFFYFYRLNYQYFKKIPLKFLQETFDCLDLPNLLIDIWSYAEHLYHNPSLAPPCRCVCKVYLEFCINATKKKWSDTYVNFDFVVHNLKDRNRCFADFGKILTEKKDMIYQIIAKAINLFCLKV